MRQTLAICDAAPVHAVSGLAHPLRFAVGMVVALIVLLIVLWFLGYVQIPSFVVPDVPLFAVNGHVVTLVEGLIFLALLAAAGLLPTPIRQIAFVALVLWLLSTLGILAISGLSSILVIAIIVGLIASLLGLIGRPRETVTVIREDPI